MECLGWGVSVLIGGICSPIVEVLIKPYWGNDYGDLGMRSHVYGDGWSLWSKGSNEVGLCIQLKGLMGVAFGGVLVRDGTVFFNSCILRWGTAHE